MKAKCLYNWLRCALLLHSMACNYIFKTKQISFMFTFPSGIVFSATRSLDSKSIHTDSKLLCIHKWIIAHSEYEISTEIGIIITQTHGAFFPSSRFMLSANILSFFQIHHHFFTTNVINTSISCRCNSAYIGYIINQCRYKLIIFFTRFTYRVCRW